METNHPRPDIGLVDLKNGILGISLSKRAFFVHKRCNSLLLLNIFGTTDYDQVICLELLSQTVHTFSRNCVSHPLCMRENQ